MKASSEAGASRPRRWRRWLLAAVALGVCALGWLGWSGKGTSVVDAVFEEQSIQRVESYAPILREVAEEFDLDPCLMAGMMYVESRGRADAVSSANALGLMQLSLAAASDAARKLGLHEPDKEQLLEDPALNIRLAGRHLQWLIRLNEPGDIERVLIEYNAGRTKLQRWVDAAGGYRKWRAQRVEAGGGGVLAYARHAQYWAERFRERGNITGP